LRACSAWLCQANTDIGPDVPAGYSDNRSVRFEWTAPDPGGRAWNAASLKPCGLAREKGERKSGSRVQPWTTPMFGASDIRSR
jgi:hypothetical protein